MIDAFVVKGVDPAQDAVTSDTMVHPGLPDI